MNDGIEFMRELQRVEEENEFWFERLAGMQIDEQADLLRVRINEVKAARDWALHYRQTFRLNALKRKLETELHRVNQVLIRARWKEAIYRVYGQEGLDRVMIEIEHSRDLPYVNT